MTLVRIMATALALVVSVVSAAAKDWKVDGHLAGRHGEGKPAVDISGIACATDKGFPRTCLVIDDELQAAQVVKLTDGRIEPGRLIPLIDDKFDGEPLELDGEGVAYADGYFYVVGSHGRPRHARQATEKDRSSLAALIAASSKLVRLRYDAASGVIAPRPEDVSISTGLRELIANEPALGPFRDKSLEDGGITLEGVAIRDGRLLAGFRGPSIKNKGAVILSVALGHFFDRKPADAKVHYLDLGKGHGVRDLAPYRDGVLILAGPVGDVDGTYSVFWWKGSGKRVKLLKDLPAYRSDKDKQWKPEALLPLDRNRKGLRVLLMLDGADDGGPRTARIPRP